ncbi:MAG: hypothetical protein RJA22_2101 [Verrucomicrobiota bacterium]
MSLQLDLTGGLLRLQGRLDAAGAQQLSTWLAQASAPPFAWDFSALEFLSSAGIRSLLALDRRVRAAGGVPQVVVTTPIIRDALTIAGLQGSWELHGSVPAALAAAARLATGAAPEVFTGTSGIPHHITAPAIPGTGTVMGFPAAPDGRPFALRFEELGLALGRGALEGDPRSATPPGLLLATGRTVFVQAVGGLTDYVTTPDPARSFAWVTEAIRFDLAGVERWDTQGPVRWGALLGDFDARAIHLGAHRHWAAVVSARAEGRTLLLLALAEPGRSLQVVALAGGAGAGAGALPDLPDSPAAAAARADDLEEPTLVRPGEELLLEAARTWFLPAPRQCPGEAIRLAIESDEPLPQDWECIVRATFREAARVRLRRLSGGFTASTFAAETTDREGRRTLPTVLKLSPRPITAREEAAYHESVRPFILNNATVLFDRAAHGDVAGLRYNFVGITGAESRLQPLEALYRGDRFPEAVAALRQTLTNVLEPWYGQARVSAVRPFAQHDPRGLFPTLPEAAQEALGIDPDQPLFPCPPLRRSLPNPYHLLRHRWDALLAHTVSWAAGITHGDLNLNNILIDERRNLYVIDFSETRLRSVASDHARLEPIALLQWTRLSQPGDADMVLQVVQGSLRGPVWSMPAPPPEATDPMLHRAIALVSELRALAARRVADPAHEAAYLMPLLEWTMPIVAFRQLEKERKQLAAWAAGLILEKLQRVLPFHA